MGSGTKGCLFRFLSARPEFYNFHYPFSVQSKIGIANQIRVNFLGAVNALSYGADDERLSDVHVACGVDATPNASVT